MSQAIFQSVLVVFGILFQVLITSFIQPMGFKLNWVLMILIILAFLHGNRLIPFLAIFAGIWCDLMSHGMIGVYGISFLFVILVTQWISTWFYSHTLLLGMIVFFTFLTFYSAYYNKVTDCGCFGDAIKLSPWGSFVKDLILLVFISILFIGEKHIKALLNRKMENMFLAIVTFFCFAFVFHPSWH